VVGENGDDEGFGDELLAIDVDSLVAARETQLSLPFDFVSTLHTVLLVTFTSLTKNGINT